MLQHQHVGRPPRSLASSAVDVPIAPKSDLEMWEHAKVMTEATPRHSSCRFFRESSTSFQALSGSNQALALGAKKIMYMHCADCHSILLLLGQEGARLPHHGNLAVEPRQHVVSPKNIILRKNVTN